jgi:hypothetical protein
MMERICFTPLPFDDSFYLTSLRGSLFILFFCLGNRNTCILNSETMWDVPSTFSEAMWVTGLFVKVKFHGVRRIRRNFVMKSFFVVFWMRKITRQSWSRQFVSKMWSRKQAFFIEVSNVCTRISVDASLWTFKKPTKDYLENPLIHATW